LAAAGGNSTGGLSIPGSPGQNGWAVAGNAAGGIGGGTFGTPNTVFPLALGGIPGNFPGGGSSGGAASASLPGGDGLVTVQW
jgi:hypothetical protein